MITNDVKYIGVNDREVDLFEGQYVVPNGMAYNSYVILDEKIAVMDTVDGNFTHEWLDNLANVLNGKKPDYLIVQHMEPDHSANIDNFTKVYPDAKIVCNAKTLVMMNAFFGKDFTDKTLIVKDGESLSLGKHNLTFVFAPMVHWPEVMVTYDSTDKILFSADGFGKFGALDADEDWACEARRYYIGIVGKYGAQVQALLKKASALDIKIICPLHGPILTENLGYYINLYDIWSSYKVESEGVVIAYTSVYGNTKKAVMLLKEKLLAKGCPKVTVTDLARDDMAEAVEDAFRYGKLVLATTTYNGDVFPFMRVFINHLTERNYQNRQIAIIENGSWAPVAGKVIKGMLEKCKNIDFVDPVVTIRSAMDENAKSQIDAVAQVLCADYKENIASTPKTDSKALFKIGYGLYVVTTFDGKKDNAMICNTVTQVADNPKIAVTISKQNYTYNVIKKTGKLNVNFLTESAPFSVFEKFGFKSGRNTDKLIGNYERTKNGLVVLDKNVNAVMSLNVEDYLDLGSHGMFVCSVEESKVISNEKSMTYEYYHAFVKPKPKKSNLKGYVCKICGYFHAGDTLPEDFICPICKHPASDFEPTK